MFALFVLKSRKLEFEVRGWFIVWLLVIEGGKLQP